MRARVVIIGGGMTGLAAAHRVRELQPSTEVVILEASDRLGGLLGTHHRDGYLLEQAADGLLTSLPWGIDFCARVGCELLPLERVRHPALVVHRGRLRPIPAGFTLLAPARIWPVLTTPVLSLRGKARLAAEPLIPAAGGDQDESVAAFVRRRMGREVYDRLVQPLIDGLYAGDGERLSVQALLPHFRQMEGRIGGLSRGVRRLDRRPQVALPRGASRSRFIAPAEGMGQLIERAAARLPAEAIRLKAPVVDLRPSLPHGWRITVAGPQRGVLTAQGVILATPAAQAAQLLAPSIPEAALLLREIPYTSCALLWLGYRCEQIGRQLNSYGFFVPRAEKRLIATCNFSSVKYAGRAPAGSVLFRVVVGGSQQGHLLRLTDADLVELAQCELARLLRISGGPEMAEVCRLWHVMPQYNVGHVARRRAIDAQLERFPTLALAGSALRGIGVPHCIHGGEQAAARVVAALQPQQELAAS